MAIGPIQGNSASASAPSLAYGIRDANEVITILGALKIDGTPVITDDKAALNPQMKAEQVMKFFNDNFKIKPADLPQVASVIKQDLKAGKLGWEA
jgi:hypothetical protein